MMKTVVIFSRDGSRMLGGLELFNHQLRSLISKKAQVFQSPERYRNVLISYIVRVWDTILYCNFNRPHVIIVQYGSFYDILSLPFLLLGRCNISVICHVSSSWIHLRHPVSCRITMLLLGLAQNVLVLSNDQGNVFKDVKPKKIHTIIRPDFLKPHGSHIKAGFLYFGRLSIEKGVFDLVAAWEILRDCGTNTTLTMVGPANDYTLKELMSLIAIKKLESYITVLPTHLGAEQLIEMIDSSEGVLCCSYKDAFPLTMLEACSRGTPCIVSSIGEGPAFINHPALTVLPGDCTAIARAVTFVASGCLSEGYIRSKMKAARRYVGSAIMDDLERFEIIEN